MPPKFFYKSAKTKSSNSKSTNSQTSVIPSIFVPTEEYLEAVRSVAYLGKKGYTVPKSVLLPEDYVYLKKELFVKPVVMGQPQEEGAFSVYRENDAKIYLPRFYGIHRYGLPGRSEIQEGEEVDIDFVGDLRDYQQNIVKTYVDHCKRPICRGSTNCDSGSTNCGGGGILEVPCGRGKCLGKDTPILMYDGEIKLVQDIVVGDLIMGDDSTPRKVLTLARGREMMYKVETKKGDGYIVNESHILSLKYGTYMNKKTPKNTILDISVLDYLNLPKSYHGRGGPLYGYRVPIKFEEKEVELDPYLFGFWLGDGASKGTLVTTQESCVIKYIADCFKEKHTSLYLKYTGHQYDYRINSTLVHKNIMMDFLKKNNLIHNKHIPQDYKCNSRKIQLQLLAGIIDSDGYLHDNCYEIVQKNEVLLDDIIYIAKSLGFSAYKKKVNKTCTNNGKTGIYYLTNISGEGLEEIPVKCKRKKATVRKLLRDVLKYRISLKKMDIDDYYGFEIDGNHRFVLGDFTVTHNTVMGLKIITALCNEPAKGKKTIILVHKEFLMNQWIERIADFLPSARVGKIQANKLEIEGKDIVLGMIQTLFSRDFPAGTFDSFALLIIDEVHHIGSEMFSKTLLKIVTPYVLGISATVERKDKLTKVLYMFIGPKIYSEERKQDDAVMVHGIYYKTTDEQFSETEYDWKGQPKYSTMISKICDYGPRSDFIVRVLTDVLDSYCSEDKGQVMILSHNRSLLTYLYNAIEYRKIASVGFYVGGMKERDLKETEEKKIVLATYSMAAEALDIKTLSILIMATPKKDIEQSVGRILRVKHDNPIVIDIIDPHPLFQNQWQTRKRFYKKCNYGILTIDSSKYKGMMKEDGWNNVHSSVNCQQNISDSEEGDIEESKEECIQNSRLAKYMI